MTSCDVFAVNAVHAVGTPETWPGRRFLSADAQRSVALLARVKPPPGPPPKAHGAAGSEFGTPAGPVPCDSSPACSSASSSSSSSTTTACARAGRECPAGPAVARPIQAGAPSQRLQLARATAALKALPQGSRSGGPRAAIRRLARAPRDTAFRKRALLGARYAAVINSAPAPRALSAHGPPVCAATSALPSRSSVGGTTLSRRPWASSVSGHSVSRTQALSPITGRRSTRHARS